MKVMTDKQWKFYEDYIATLENQLKEQTKEYEKLRKEKEELEKKYKKVKMELYLKNGGE